jgi:hypothetical protein
MEKGERHGKLVFLEDLGVHPRYRSIGWFVCDCGNVCVKTLAYVRNGATRSCLVCGGGERRK